MNQPEVPDGFRLFDSDGLEVDPDSEVWAKPEPAPEPVKADLYAELKSPGTQMAMAMARVKRDSEVYGGTVPHHVTAARRAKNKRARAGRKAQRKSK